MKRRSWYALGSLGALLLALGLLQTPLLGTLRGQTWLVWTQSVGGWFKVGSLTVSDSVTDQLARLQAENVRLRAEVIDLGRLREQLGSPAFAGYRSVKAEVAARPLDPFHARFILSRGARDGIVLGAPVVIASSTLVGFVSELHEGTAVLQLLFHPSTSLPAEVLLEDTSSKGLLRGKSFTAVQLTNVPRDIPLRVGQDVVATNQQGIMPPGLLIGQIATVNDEPHEPFQQARVRVPYDSDQLYAVAVLVAN